MVRRNLESLGFPLAAALDGYAFAALVRRAYSRASRNGSGVRDLPEACCGHLQGYSGINAPARMDRQRPSASSRPQPMANHLAVEG